MDAQEDSSDSDSEDGFRVFDDVRLCHAGGAGTPRPDRAAPRPFLSSTNGEPDIRRHFGIDGEWGRVFFKPELIPTSLG